MTSQFSDGCFGGTGGGEGRGGWRGGEGGASAVATGLGEVAVSSGKRRD